MLDKGNQDSMYLGEKKADSKRAKEYELHHSYSRAHRALQNNPQSVTLQEDMYRESKSLANFEKQQADWMDTIIQARTIDSWERCTHLFFGSFKEPSKATKISALFDENNQLHTMW